MTDDIILTISPELKRNLLCKLGLDTTDVCILVGCKKSKASEIMRICRDEFDGQAGILTNRITPASLCRCCGTTLKEELANLEELRFKREQLLKRNGQ